MLWYSFYMNKRRIWLIIGGPIVGGLVAWLLSGNVRLGIYLLITLSLVNAFVYRKK